MSEAPCDLLVVGAGAAGLTAALTAAVDFAAVKETNLLERAEVELPFEKNRVRLRFRAFEIKTLSYPLDVVFVGPDRRVGVEQMAR